MVVRYHILKVVLIILRYLGNIFSKVIGSLYLPSHVGESVEGFLV
jgi:hypothetical protein